MRKFLIPSKDTSIYQTYPNINAGFDEILDIGKVVDPISTISNTYSTGSARTLLYFDLPTTQSVFSGSNFYLNLKLANVSKIKKNQEILIYQISRSWDEGSGYFYQTKNNVEDGASWVRFDQFTSWSLAGGNFLTGSISSSIKLNQYPLEDLRIDVTDIVRPFVSNSLQNEFYGLALQFPLSDETSSLNEGNIKVFSSQTHTIHQPTLEIAWDDQVYITGSKLLRIPDFNVKVIVSNIKETYFKGDVSKIELVVRDEYPLRSFDSTLRYKNKYYLPSSSYYSIIDTQANITVVPFDNYSKINCDGIASYINLDTSPLYKGRFYTLRIKIESGSYSRIIDSDVSFRIL